MQEERGSYSFIAAVSTLWTCRQPVLGVGESRGHTQEPRAASLLTAFASTEFSVLGHLDTGRDVLQLHFQPDSSSTNACYF